MRLVVISGHSGSGKTSALNILEDVGFTCIDKRKLQAKHGKLIFAKLIFKVIEQTPNAAIRFSDYPSNIHVLNKASENISIHLEEGRILEDKERSIPINNTEIKQPTCNKPKSGYIAIHADQNIFSMLWCQRIYSIP